MSEPFLALFTHSEVFLWHTSLHADAGQLLVVCHQGDAVACQILLEQVDLINGHRDDLAIHVGASQNHKTGQVVLAAHLQHLRRVVAEQQRGVGEVQASIILLKAGQASSSVMTVSSISGAMAAR